jgi:DNA-binding transcriptional MerR regulator
MSYTVKKLSELSGVTVRALHFYDEVGLLKPAYYGSNGYRYYEEKELLQLQQILFFKELGLKVNQIKKIIGRSDFDQLASLHSHRKALRREWEKIGQLLDTVDKTIKHLQGKKKMKDTEIYKGFYEWTKGKGEEFFFIRKYDPKKFESEAEKIVLNSVKIHSNENKDKSYYEDLEKTYKEIYEKISECLESKLKPSSVKVQRLIRKHYEFTERFHACTKEVYKALAQLYHGKDQYKKQLNHFHPKLAEFMATAMDEFAERELG